MRGTRRPQRRRWQLPVLVVVGALLVVGSGAGIVAFALTNGFAPAITAAPAGAEDGSADDEETASDEPLRSVPTPSPSPIGEDGEAEVERASAAIEQVVSATNEIGARSDGSAVGADLVATGFVLGELQSFAQEQLDLGYRQSGKAVVTAVTASDVVLTGETPTMTLTVCVDVSGIDVIDEAGTSRRASLYDPGHPVKHVYGAEFVDGLWKASSHDIPDLQDCAQPE